MSDKVVVQQQLAQELANLVLTVSGLGDDAGQRITDVALDDTTRVLAVLDFYQGFWTTVQGAWHGVDKFRYVCLLTLASTSTTR